MGRIERTINDKFEPNSNSNANANDMGSGKSHKKSSSGYSSEERRQQKKAPKPQQHDKTAEYNDGYDSQQSECGSFPHGATDEDSRRRAQERRNKNEYARGHKGVKRQEPPPSRESLSAGHIQDFDAQYHTKHGYQTYPQTAYTSQPRYPQELELGSEDGSSRGHGAPAYYGYPDDNRYYPSDSRYHPGDGRYH